MQKTFYAAVTQFDCDPARAPADSPAEGPLLFETYLNDFHTDEQRVRADAERRFTRYGWVRIAKVTIDLPGESDVSHS